MTVQQVGVFGGQNSVFDLAREAPHVDHVGGGATAGERGECVLSLSLSFSLYLGRFTFAPYLLNRILSRFY